uniref:Uncharacterized protein n=1 Tax=Anguilla anguilla TaxID=7936 RepID=A0A0E9V3F4_ANGAN
MQSPFFAHFFIDGCDTRKPVLEDLSRHSEEYSR